MQSLIFVFGKLTGRLRRRSYWSWAITLTIFFAAFYALLERFIGEASTLLLYPFFLWGAFALMVKRLHDSAKSGWRLVLIVVPIVGPILLLFWLCFSRGTQGANEYGDDPRSENADYLVVNISS